MFAYVVFSPFFEFTELTPLNILSALAIHENCLLILHLKQLVCLTYETRWIIMRITVLVT
jgi:hypothetical protein